MRRVEVDVLDLGGLGGGDGHVADCKLVEKGGAVAIDPIGAAATGWIIEAEDQLPALAQRRIRRDGQPT